MEEKIGFFKKAKKAIFNFDEYQKFSNEKVSKTFGYLFKLVLILTILITISTTYKTYNIAGNTMQKFIEESPNFEVKNGILTVENDLTYKYIDNDNYFGVIIDSSKEDLENIEYNEGIAFSKDKIYIKSNNQTRVIKYADIMNANFDKEDINELLTTKNLIKVYLLIGLVIFITNVIVYTIVFLFDILVLFIIGKIINWIAKTNIKSKGIFNIAVYSMTLPIILLIIYNLLILSFGFKIKYFDLAYDIISYIYVVTAILLIKSDGIKNMQEIPIKDKTQEKQKKIVEHQNKREKKKKENKEEKDKKDKKDKKEPGEPEGSNA